MDFEFLSVEGFLEGLVAGFDAVIAHFSIGDQDDGG